MSKIVTKRKTEEIEIHPYDVRIDKAYKLIEKELSKENISLIKSYDRYMVRQSLDKATRLKHLQIILNLSRIVKKDWENVNKKDIDDLVFKVVQIYGDANGKETNTTYDHKKNSKDIFQMG